MAIRAAAPPPTALNSDTSCGIAVIFTPRAVYRPSPPPSAMPAMITSQPVTLIASVASPSGTTVSGMAISSTAVATIATSMPPADSRLPLRAVAGEFIRIRPMTKATAPASQASRTRTSMVASTLRLRLVGLRRRRGRLALEHLEHPVGDDVAADDVHRRERHCDERDRVAQRVIGGDRDDHGADEHDAMDRVCARHQGRVERRRHLRDNRESAQDREDEDREVREQQLDFGAHAWPPAGAGWSSFWTGSATTAPSCVITVDFVTSSSMSN